MIDKANFKREFGEALGSVALTKKGSSWFGVGSDAIIVLNLQKSDYDEKYYVNFGVWLKSLGDTQFPSENKCHIQARLTSLFPESCELIERGCRLETGADASVAFFAFLADEVAPFCKRCLTIEGLKAEFLTGRFRKALIMKPAKDLLAAT